MSTSFDFPLDPILDEIVTLPDGSEAQWNGYAWAPVGGSSDVTYPIPIDKGGTNAITANEARINLGLNTTTGEFVIPDGTVTNPGLAFTNEPGLGMYRSEAARLGFTAGGNEVLAWSAAGTTLNIGVWPLATGGSSIAFYDSPSGSAIQNTLYLGVNELGYTIQESLNGEAISKALNVTFPTGVNVNSVITVNGASNLNGPVTSNNCFIATGDVNNNAFYSQLGNILVGGTVSAYSASFTAGATGITATQVGLGNLLNARQVLDLRGGVNQIYIGWVDGLMDCQVDSSYFGGTWPIHISGSSATANYANSAGSAPANGGTAQNSNQVGGIGGWAYSNQNNNPVYLWCTEGDAQSQHLTVPGVLSVNYANRSDTCRMADRVTTVEGAGGGTLGGTLNAYGYIGRQGNAGATSNVMNTAWVGNAVQQWVDGSFIGNINTNISDERIKKDIVPLLVDHDAYMGIVPIKYKFKEISIWTDDGVEHWGWSAQNIASTLPIALVGTFDEVTKFDGEIQPAGVDERPILALTVLEVQALVNEVAELRARITALETP